MRARDRLLLTLGAVAVASLTTSLLQGGGGGDPDVPMVGEPGGPSRTLTPAELQRWLRGRELFDRNFHRSDGLGTPEMNADSCRACHQDPAIGGAGGLELNVSRFGYDHGGAGPFEDLPGGQGLSKLRPPYVDGREEYELGKPDVFEQRQTPSLFGAGLVDTIPESEILRNEDPQDLDGDGIRGVARRIPIGDTVRHVDPDTRALRVIATPGGATDYEVGRFGWKAQVPRLGDFIRDAMGGECGITTPDDGRGFALVSDVDSVADPELTQAQLDDMLFFLAHLAQPRRGGSGDPNVNAGEGIFLAVGCAACHVPELQGTAGPVPLYSDLLLHDIMPAGFRGMAEKGARSGMYKTPPLWGIVGTAPYLHDGGAETIADAILAHHGEADAARRAYEALAPSEQEALVLFLEDL